LRELFLDKLIMRLYLFLLLNKMEKKNSKTRIGKSKHGKGLFAARDLRKGEVVADLTGGKIEYAKKATDLSLLAGDYYVQFEEEGYIHQEDVICMNHSCQPNCGFSGKFKIVAMREIKKNEELNFDYAMSEDSDWRMDCKCDNENCRGVVGAYSLLTKELKEK